MELLIVVVVIAILAAITLVAYNGITANAKESALKADLNTTAKKVGITQAETGSYPSSEPAGLPDSIQYSQTSSGQGFCATASKDGKAFHITESGTIQSGACSGHTIAGGGGGGGTEIAANSPIQNVTSAQCQALPTFTGSNNDAVRTVTDNRGGTTRTYEIAKLADGKCWMLTNLKLGSTSSSITLTPADSNVASNFTLPQLTTGGNAEYDLPRAYGPVDNDPGNYGYLYNFAAATAGETLASLTTGNAQHSICPANWGLPSGGGGSGNDFGDLDIAFGGTGNYAGGGEANIAKWQPSGPFRGSFSGGWVDGFDGQGVAGYLWSASADPAYPGTAFSAGFDPSYVDPGDGYSGRGDGIGVRCLLN
ncbi:hypothetical protein ICL81_05575 [Leucobacter sp. cx-328]|nr:hypothetical protein [Leucobacter sp. cx-328]